MEIAHVKDSLEELLSEKEASFLAQQLGREDFVVLPLAGDASPRRYYRVTCGDESFVLMQWEAFEIETPFLVVQRIFAEHAVSVPKVHAVAPSLGLMLLEDLGDLTLERRFWESQDQKLVLPYYKQAIDQLIAIHGIEVPDEKTHPPFNLAFDTEKLEWELNYARKYFFEDFCGVVLTESESKSLAHEFHLICETLAHEKRVVCHRDYHSRNIMMKKNHLNVIDFQDARLGPAQYDLVSLVYDSYVELTDESVKLMLNYYRKEALEKHGRQFDDEHFEYIFDIQTIQRCFKACGSFASFWVTRKDKRYLQYLPRTIDRVGLTLKKTMPKSLLRELILDVQPLLSELIES